MGHSAQYKFASVILLAFGLFFIVPSAYEVHKAGQARDWEPKQRAVSF